MKYDSKQIEVLKGLEGVRKRPAMYIGSRGLRGLHQIVYEVIDNSVDEVLAGYCQHIRVVIHSDGSFSVEDDGRGIPVDIHHETKRPGVEVVMTTLHAGSKFGGGGYKVSGGLHGVGVSVTNALSEWLEVEVYRDDKIHFQRYERGNPVSDLKVRGKTDKRGTKTRFKPDAEIFETTVADAEILGERLHELAYLNPEVEITLSVEETGVVQVYREKGGVGAYCSHLHGNATLLHRKPLHLQGKSGDTEIEVALQYNNGFQENIVSFVNDIKTVDGGTHVSGFKTSLTRVVNQVARKTGLLKEKDSNLVGDDVREGLCAVISLKLTDPQFEGQTKAKLGNSEVEGMVSSLIYEQLATAFEEDPQTKRRILEKAITAARAREAAKRASELVKRKSGLDNPDLPGKLKDCRSRNPAECEVFIVEGDSAGGSAETARDSRFQAVLAIKGKTINVEKHRLDKILANAEIRAIISAMGTGILSGGSDNGNGGENENGQGEGFDHSRLRYHRIVLMTDADVDGARIRTLLLAFFFRHMAPLIEKGHIYIAQLPIYSVKTAREQRYVYTDEELEKVRSEIKGKNLTITRFKGLAEMNAEQLADTGMNPETRTLLRVTLDDASKADAIFTVLMGSEVAPRKAFIVEHAREVRNLDI